jgi:hypothetical protein
MRMRINPHSLQGSYPELLAIPPSIPVAIIFHFFLHGNHGAALLPGEKPPVRTE